MAFSKENKEDIDLNSSEIVLGLDEVVNLVQDQNLDISIAKARIEQGKGNYLGSYGKLMPSINYQASAEDFKGGEIFSGRNPINLDRRTYRSGVFGDYQIQTGGKAIWEILANKNQLNRSKEIFSDTSQKVLMEALITYFAWLESNAQIEVATQALNEAEEQLNVVEARERNGFATQLDIMQSTTLKYERQNSLLESENREKLIKMSLSIILNIGLETALITREQLIHPIDFWQKDLTLEEVIKSASENRPDLKALTYTVKEARLRLGSAIADLFPTISVSGYIRQIGPELNNLDKTKQGMVSINVDLLKNLGIETLGNIKVSRARVEEAILNKEKQLTEMRGKIAKSFYDLKLQKDKLEVATQKLKSTQEAYRISFARLKAGVGINLEIIQAQTKLTEARSEYQENAMNYNNAQINLLYETGLLNPNQIIKASR